MTCFKYISLSVKVDFKPEFQIIFWKTLNVRLKFKLDEATIRKLRNQGGI